MGADTFLVSARVLGESDGLSLFAVSSSNANCKVRHFDLIDASSGVEIVLDEAPVAAGDLLASGSNAENCIRLAISDTLIAMGSESVGLCEAVIGITCDYVQVRKQFGKRIGDFQALQHRLADMFIAAEELKSTVLAALATTGSELEEREQAASALKVQMGRLARFVMAQAIQLHGGIGLTEELAVGHYFRRFLAMEALAFRRDVGVSPSTYRSRRTTA